MISNKAQGTVSPQNPWAIDSPSLTRYKRPGKITVAGPPISEVTKRKNPKKGTSVPRGSHRHANLVTAAQMKRGTTCAHTANTLYSLSVYKSHRDVDGTPLMEHFSQYSGALPAPSAHPARFLKRHPLP